ncbi:MAG: thiamine phosphate synthase [Actinobacteria bacterium]|nr:thiamine phosphate synthase [Actinomycetota bacterium]
MSLDSAQLYLVAPARLTAGRLADLVGELAGAGVDLIQLREKDLEARDVLRAAEPVVSACRAAGIPFIINDRPDIALALGADGVHLGQNDLPVEVARRVCPEAIVGLSTHAPGEIDAVTRADVSYFAVGPVEATPTKPGRPAAGIDLIRYASRTTGSPWFAIGGINADNLDRVLEAGARRIVVVRAVTESRDPPAAAARLRSMLEGAP